MDPTPGHPVGALLPSRRGKGTRSPTPRGPGDPAHPAGRDEVKGTLRNTPLAPHTPVPTQWENPQHPCPPQGTREQLHIPGPRRSPSLPRCTKSKKTTPARSQPPAHSRAGTPGDPPQHPRSVARPAPSTHRLGSPARCSWASCWPRSASSPGRSAASCSPNTAARRGAAALVNMGPGPGRRGRRGGAAPAPRSQWAGRGGSPAGVGPGAAGARPSRGDCPGLRSPGTTALSARVPARKPLLLLVKMKEAFLASLRRASPSRAPRGDQPVLRREAEQGAVRQPHGLRARARETCDSGA